MLTQIIGFQTQSYVFIYGNCVHSIKEDLHSYYMSPAIYRGLQEFRGKHKTSVSKSPNNIFMSTGKILITLKIPST